MPLPERQIATRCLGHTSKVLSVAFRPDGARLVTTSADGTVRQWDPETGDEVEPAFDHRGGEVLSAAYSPDGEWVALGGRGPHRPPLAGDGTTGDRHGTQRPHGARERGGVYTGRSAASLRE